MATNLVTIEHSNFGKTQVPEQAVDRFVKAGWTKVDSEAAPVAVPAQPTEAPAPKASSPKVAKAESNDNSEETK